MDKLTNLINVQTLDMILSDPMLLAGTSLVALGTVLFLVSAVKFLLYKDHSGNMLMPHHEIEDEYAPQPMESSAHPPEPLPEPEPEPEPVRRPARMVNHSEETMIMAPGVSDLQAQFEIAITQIKQLNKKVYELERQIETISSHAAVKLEPNELKEPPMDAADFSKKLLKVVEHVIMLEKEVVKLRDKEPSKPNFTEEPASAAAIPSKPTIMPL